MAPSHTSIVMLRKRPAMFGLHEVPHGVQQSNMQPLDQPPNNVLELVQALLLKAPQQLLLQRSKRALKQGWVVVLWPRLLAKILI
jgi:hypothetical protein